MKSVVIHLLAAFYLAGAIFTFGIAYNRTECPAGGVPCPDLKASAALLAGVFWPLALSAIAQEGGAE